MTDDPKNYRLTIEDLNPSWSEWSSGRRADVHGAPAGAHWWIDRDGGRVNGYEEGSRCGGCGWRPESAEPGDRPSARV
jgi:hypothetical protein